MLNPTSGNTQVASRVILYIIFFYGGLGFDHDYPILLNVSHTCSSFFLVPKSNGDLMLDAWEIPLLNTVVPPKCRPTLVLIT